MKKNTEQHKYSKQFLIITSIVVLLSLSGAGYFGYKTYQIKTAKNKKTDTAQPASEEKKAEEVKDVPKEETKTVAVTEIQKEVKTIDVTEIKAAITDLKSSMSSFSR